MVQFTYERGGMKAAREEESCVTSFGNKTTAFDDIIVIATIQFASDRFELVYFQWNCCPWHTIGELGSDDTVVLYIVYLYMCEGIIDSSHRLDRGIFQFRLNCGANNIQIPSRHNAPLNQTIDWLRCALTLYGKIRCRFTETNGFHSDYVAPAWMRTWRIMTVCNLSVRQII